MCAQLFVARVESQLDGADALNIRQVINGHYERIVASMFDCLQQMAKMDGEGQGTQGEAKDQLNYHVILIGARLSLPVPSRRSARCQSEPN